MPDRLVLGQVGCGGMGLRHVQGLIEAQQQGLGRFDLVAVCDIHEAAADHVASVAEKGLDRRPHVYTDFETMLRLEPGLDAVNVVTDTRMHHIFTLQALAAGKHVAVEKPMGLTVRACHLMLDAARRASRVLSVSENFRRDPLVRLAKAILEAGVIGDPRLFLDISLSGTRAVQQVATWRHLKLRGGWLLETAVHDADLAHYLLGEVDQVFAETELWEELRHVTSTAAGTTARAEEIARFYGHRVKEVLDEEGWMRATAEDTALAVVRFRSGAVGQFTFSIATPGSGLDVQVIHGRDGSLTLPRNRTGGPLEMTPLGGEPLRGEDLLALVPAFRLDDVTAQLFGGRARLSSYTLSFAEVDRKLIAIELVDFADAIQTPRMPEVTGLEGLEAVAFVYAMLESSRARQPLEFRKVADDVVTSYQREINDSVSL